MLILDLIISVLLVWTIIFCWQLNKKIASIRGSKKALEGFVGNFDRVIGEADRILRDLKSIDRDTSELRRSIDKAQHLIDELSIVTTSAVRVADRLERSIVQPQQQAKPATVTPPVRNGLSAILPISEIKTVEDDHQKQRHVAIESLLQQIAKARQSSRSITEQAQSEDA
ncbi:MAG: hypothetical protein IPP74_04535 [Alphaproteobacteria bacterium]|nr:hypothetical protein [Alphaproteobacteria bacterium]